MTSPRVPRFAVVVTVLVAIAVAAALLTMALGIRGYSRPLLVLASTGFVAVALLRGGLRHRFGQLLTGGLLLCWLGDFLGPIDFSLGVVAFLLAHLAFVGAFLLHGLSRRKLLVSLAVCVLVSAAVLLWLLPHVLSRDRLLIVGYTCAITLMLAFAFGTRPGFPRGILLPGAAVFYVSDLFVARWAFVGGGAVNAYFCYPLYYAACLLLAHAAGSPALQDVAEPPGERIVQR